MHSHELYTHLPHERSHNFAQMTYSTALETGRWIMPGEGLPLEVQADQGSVCVAAPN